MATSCCTSSGARWSTPKGAAGQDLAGIDETGMPFRSKHDPTGRPKGGKRPAGKIFVVGAVELSQDGEPRGVALQQLEGRGRAIAGADLLVGGRDRLRWQAGPVISPVLEAEAVEPAVPRLEEGHDAGEIVRAADAVR